MHINDGFSIAAMTAGATALTVCVGYLQNRYGKRIDRQSAIETNLQLQVNSNIARVQNLEAQIEALNQDRRKVEAEHNAEVQALEEKLSAANAALLEARNELWLLRRGVIGADERQ